MKNEELTTLKFSYPEGQERTVRVYDLHDRRTEPL